MLVLPFSPMGLVALLGLGTLSMLAFGRREDVVATGITTAVVMVVAAMGPQSSHITHAEQGETDDNEEPLK